MLTASSTGPKMPPMVMAPKPTTGTCNPVRPSVRVSIARFSHAIPACRRRCIPSTLEGIPDFSLSSRERTVVGGALLERRHHLVRQDAQCALRALEGDQAAGIQLGDNAVDA